MCDTEIIIIESSDTESESGSFACDCVSHKEAVAAFDTVIRCLEQQSHTSIAISVVAVSFNVDSEC